MNKNLSWKQSLLVAFICYAIKFILSGVLPNILLAILEIVGLITLIIGIIGGIKALFTKNKHKA